MVTDRDFPVRLRRRQDGQDFGAGAAFRAGYLRGLAEGRALVSGWDEDHPPKGRHRAVAPFEWYSDMTGRAATLEALPDVPAPGRLVVRGRYTGPQAS